MSMPEVVRVQDVSKVFKLHRDTSVKDRVLHSSRARVEEFHALDNVSVDVRLNESVGLMGHNGSGKSTLLKIMGSIIRPTSGRVTTRGRMAALLELGAGFHQDLTGRENVFLNASILGMTRAETEAAFDDIVAFSGIEQFIDTQVKFYSSGMYVRLAFAVAVHSDPDVLLVDEVLAVGDEPFQRKCMDKIHSFQTEGRAIVLVSHSAEQVESVCTRGVVLDHGKLVFDGSTSDAVRILREGFQRDALAAPVHTEETGFITIRDISMTDQGGEPIRVAHTGDTICIRMDLTASKRIEDWVTAFSLDTNLGQKLHYYNSRNSGATLPAIEGDATVIITVPTLTLGEGMYRMNVSIDDAGGQPFAQRDGAWDLVVQGNGIGSGPVALDSSLAVES